MESMILFSLLFLSLFSFFAFFRLFGYTNKVLRSHVQRNILSKKIMAYVKVLKNTVKTEKIGITPLPLTV